MKVAIMQPYFFPYVGYFSLLHRADHFVVFDTPQYDRKGWMHRNRVLKEGGGWKYVSAKVKKPPFKASIKEVMLNADSGIGQLMSQLGHYKAAPCYAEMMAFLGEIEKESASCTTLVELNVLCLLKLREFIGFDCEISVFSEMELDVAEVMHSGGWALEISRAMGASEYVNPVGGRELFVFEEFEAAGIDLRFVKHRLAEYPQLGDEFESGLSVIDLLMFNAPEQIQNHLCDYQLI